MDVPHELFVEDCGIVLDGGTIVLRALDERGVEREIRICQHAIAHIGHAGWIPGRLYLDGELVELRSSNESKLVDALRRAEFRGPHPEDESSLVQAHLEFVASDQYVTFARRMDRLQDASRYSAWLCCSESLRSRAAARLNYALKIELGRAREIVEHGLPIVDSVTADALFDVAERLARVGLGMTVRPQYPFPLPPLQLG